MVNNHFVDNCRLYLSVNKESKVGAHACLDTLCLDLDDMVIDYMIEFWLVGLDSPPNWIPKTWTYIRLVMIVWYLGIPFGVGLSPISMLEWCLHRLQSKPLWGSSTSHSINIALYLQVWGTCYYCITCPYVPNMYALLIPK